MRQPLRAKISVETVFIREFAAVYGSELAWTAEAEKQMGETKVFLPQLLQVMKTGEVVHSEKDEPFGAKWIVFGKTCDDDEVWLRLEVFCDCYHVCVLGIRRC